MEEYAVVELKDFNNRNKAHSTNCCSEDKAEAIPKEYRDPSCFPIEVLHDDPHYAQHSQQCMNFVRTTTDLSQGCSQPFKPAEQVRHNVSKLVQLHLLYIQCNSTTDTVSPQLLEDLSLAARLNTRLVQDGNPAHYDVKPCLGSVLFLKPCLRSVLSLGPNPVKDVFCPSDPVKDVFCASDPVKDVFCPSDPVKDVFCPSDPVKDVFCPSDPVKDVFCPSDPVKDVFCPSDPVKDVFCPSDPVKDVFCASDPVKDVFCPSDPVKDVFCASDPVKDVFCPSDPVKDVLGPSDPVKDVFCPSDPVKDVFCPSDPVKDVFCPSDSVKDVFCPSDPVKDVFCASDPVKDVFCPSDPVKDVLGPSDPVKDVFCPSDPVKDVFCPSDPVKDVFCPSDPVKDVFCPSDPVKDVFCPSDPVKDVFCPSDPVKDVLGPSDPVKDVFCPSDPVKDIVAVTHFMDCSIIYGSSKQQTDSLREWKGGRLRMEYRHGKGFPPSSTNKSSICDHISEQEACYVAGDSRVNQNPQLTILHVVLIREHNRVAGHLNKLNPHWDDNKLFHEARRIVIAEHQHISYYEWLPIFLGWESTKHHGLTYDTHDYTHDYSEHVDPSVINGHATAAFRYFHTNIAGYLQ
uniref:Uncharacterized protein n=1 Tax=Timema monikensis TaxID=170555 RepID=A0A7R9EIV3_9NEOP|nr:unnamed protein product [Timema monikensis]